MPTIRNGRLLVEGSLVEADLHFTGGLIVEQPVDEMVIDAEGSIVSPGLIDIQINGGFGHDFTQDPTTIWQVGEHLPALGVTSFLPTVVTSPNEITDLAIEVVANRKPLGYHGADVIGLHFEGPWISPEMHGAHNAGYIVDPDADVARRWVESGQVRIVTLAPERPGANLVAQILTDGGVVVSVGHTAASFEVARDALATSATLATHLFNQMSPLRHRDPGAVGAALLSDRHATLIVDGLHLADGAVDLAWRLLGEDRTILVTDAMAALGLGPGTYPLGDGPITVGADGPRTSDGRLAGSIVTLPKAAQFLMRSTGAGVGAALKGVTANPGRVLGLVDRGSLDRGLRADMTLLDGDLSPIATFVAGEELTGR